MRLLLLLPKMMLVPMMMLKMMLLFLLFLVPKMMLVGASSPACLAVAQCLGQLATPKRRQGGYCCWCCDC